MSLSRRKFLSSAALAASLPPFPPGYSPVLRSPKDTEHVRSLRKVHSLRLEVAPRIISPQVVPGSVTGLSISVSNGVATISWQSGVAPFRIERQDYLGDPWEDTGIFTMERTVQLPVFGSSGFFRIRESVPMPVTVTVDAEGAHVSWLIPDL